LNVVVAIVISVSAGLSAEDIYACRTVPGHTINIYDTLMHLSKLTFIIRILFH
jgi:hypothetical protein